MKNSMENFETVNPEAEIETEILEAEEDEVKNFVNDEVVRLKVAKNKNNCKRKNCFYFNIFDTESNRKVATVNAPNGKVALLKFFATSGPTLSVSKVRKSKGGLWATENFYAIKN